MFKILLLVALMATSPVFSSDAAAQTPDRSRPPAVGQSAELELPPIERHRLSNGIEVVMMRKTDIPLVQMNVIVEAGQANERREAQGMASLTASLIDDGAGEYGALELSDAFDFLGARFGTSASNHYTSLSLRVPSARFNDAAALVADVLLRPHFDADELERLRLDRLTTLIRNHDDPQTIAQTLFDRTLYGDDHPYGRSAIGAEDFLRDVSAEDVRAFYDRHFGPAVTTIVLAGDVSNDHLRGLEELFGDWTNDVAPQPAAVDAPGRNGSQIYLVDVPGAAQSVIRMGYVALPRDTDEYDAINVMNTVLGGSFTSRINQNLREDKGYTYGARSSFDFRPWPGPFSTGASVFTDVTAPALQEFVNELRGIHEPIPSEEIELAKNFLAMSYPQSFQSVSRIASQLTSLVVDGMPDDYLNTYTSRILSVAPESAQAATAHIDPDNLTIVVVGDRSVIEESIRELNLAPVEVLSVRDVLGEVPTIAMETTP